MKALDEAGAQGEQADADPDLAKARTFLDYAYFRIAEDARRAEYLERAVALATAAARRGAEPLAWLIAGRALMQLRRCQEAEQMFTRYIEAAGEDVKGLLWRAEARLHLGAYAGVRQDCARALQCGQVPEAVAEAVKLWT